MSYCVNCGVELADSEKICPLCKTPVVNPNVIKESIEAESPYPPFRKIQTQKVSRSSIVAILTILFLLPISITIICNLSLDGKITWSGFVFASLALLYIFTIFPIAIRKMNPIAAIIIDALALCGFLFFIETATGGNWLLGFAMPVVMLITITVLLIVSFNKYSDISGLIISAIFFFLLAADMLLLEILINSSFLPQISGLIWSQYPAIVFVIIAIILLYINSNTPLREKLARKFFI